VATQDAAVPRISFAERYGFNACDVGAKVHAADARVEGEQPHR
jgi:hypothetical protein